MAQKKRRLRRGRLAIVTGVLAVLIVVIAGGIAGFMVWQNREHQKQMRETLSEHIEFLNRQREKIEAIQQPGAGTQDVMDPALFEQMKQSALATVDTGANQALLERKTLSVDEVNAALDSKGSQQDQQCLSLMENIDQYPASLLEFYMKDPDRYAFVSAWPDRAQYQTAPEQLEESLDSVPQLLQWDTRWGYLPYGDSLLYINGCAPTCLSMVLSYLKQDPTITPAVIKNWSDAYGYYVPGAGSSHELLTAAAAPYGVAVEGVEISQEAVHQALAEGKVLIFNMVPGTFTTVGHFIVVTGEENGQLIVNDPNSIARSSRRWSYEEVLPETAMIWAYSLPAAQ